MARETKAEKLKRERKEKREAAKARKELKRQEVERLAASRSEEKPPEEKPPEEKPPEEKPPSLGDLPSGEVSDILPSLEAGAGDLPPADLAEEEEDQSEPLPSGFPYPPLHTAEEVLATVAASSKEVHAYGLGSVLVPPLKRFKFWLGGLTMSSEEETEIKGAIDAAAASKGVALSPVPAALLAILFCLFPCIFTPTFKTRLAEMRGEKGPENDESL